MHDTGYRKSEADVQRPEQLAICGFWFVLYDNPEFVESLSLYLVLFLLISGIFRIFQAFGLAGAIRFVQIREPLRCNPGIWPKNNLESV